MFIIYKSNVKQIEENHDMISYWQVMKYIFTLNRDVNKQDYRYWSDINKIITLVKNNNMDGYFQMRIYRPYLFNRNVNTTLYVQMRKTSIIPELEKWIKTKLIWFCRIIPCYLSKEILNEFWKIFSIRVISCETLFIVTSTQSKFISTKLFQKAINKKEFKKLFKLFHDHSSLQGLRKCHSYPEYSLDHFTVSTL